VNRPDSLRGPRFEISDRHHAVLAGDQNSAPTLKGWVLGLLSVALIALILPHIDLVIRSTKYSMNLLPPTSLFLMFLFILAFNMGLAKFKTTLALSRQDLALVFAMTMLINPLPTYGYMVYMTVEQMGGFFYATPENNWAKLIHPLIPEGLAARDPADPASLDPRPVQWYFSGMPPEASVPWNLLFLPYARWTLALVLVLGMFLALGALLHQHWSHHERLPFPLAQVPEMMMGGLPFGSGNDGQKPFLGDRIAWWGIATTFLLHLYNGAADYFPTVARIPLRITHIDGTYLTEAPYRHAHPYYFIIYPSVIGIMYLVSLEVSFSLWFFYAVVLKAGVLIAVLWFGIGNDGWAFNGTEGNSSIFTAQGAGACFMMVLIGFYLARSSLFVSLKQALGLDATEDRGHVSPRVIWLLLAGCFAGSVAWLMWAGVSFHWSLLAVIILLLSVTGVTRLVSEGGVFWLQLYGNPAEQLASVFTPVGLGPQNFLLLSMWSRVFAFDWYRSNPMINIVGALHLGSQSRMRTKPLFMGLAAALLIAFGVAFFSYHHTIYTAPGGARPMGWAYEAHAAGEFKGLGTKLAQMKAWDEKQAGYAASGKEIPATEVPTVARTDWTRISWLGAGAAVMALFMFLRTRLFWWPHPIGYVMWMGSWPLHRMWFSYFLGWLCKLLILKYGGQRTYLNCRRYFIGLIVGEALAVIFWTAIHYYTGRSEGYSMEYN